MPPPVRFPRGNIPTVSPRRPGRRHRCRRIRTRSSPPSSSTRRPRHRRGVSFPRNLPARGRLKVSGRLRARSRCKVSGRLPARSRCSPRAREAMNGADVMEDGPGRAGTRALGTKAGKRHSPRARATSPRPQARASSPPTHRTRRPSSRRPLDIPSRRLPRSRTVRHRRRDHAGAPGRRAGVTRGRHGAGPAITRKAAPGSSTSRRNRPPR